MNNIKKEIRVINIIMLLAAGFINAVGVTLFLFPVKLYDSGVSGASMLLDQITPPYLTLPLFLLIINIPIFLFGAKRLGLSFTVYSVTAVAAYAFASFMIVNVLPVDVEFVSPLAGEDLLLCSIFGGVISGVGSGMTIRAGGAIDGIDVLSVLFAKPLGLSLGTFVMIFNTVLYIICGIILGSWILPLYSIVTYFVGAKTVDFIVEGFDKTICAMIVTTKEEEISEALKENFRSTGTVVSGIGGYSREEKGIIYFILNHFQITKLKNIVTSIDPDAFISLQEVADIIRKHRQDM